MASAAGAGYLAGVKLCERYGALYIADEVQTGPMRTGELWPSASTASTRTSWLGKGISGGMYPVSVVLATEAAAGWLTEDGFAHMSTFGGAELGCVAALKTLEITTRPEVSVDGALHRGGVHRRGWPGSRASTGPGSPASGRTGWSSAWSSAIRRAPVRDEAAVRERRGALFDPRPRCCSQAGHPADPGTVPRNCSSGPRRPSARPAMTQLKGDAGDGKPISVSELLHRPGPVPRARAMLQRAERAARRSPVRRAEEWTRSCVLLLKPARPRRASTRSGGANRVRRG